MDLNGYHNFLINLSTQTASLGERLLVIPANNMIMEIDERITKKGLDSNGNKIGDYSKKPFWADVRSFDNKSNFKPANKKNGKGKRKSIDLEEGYYELRKIQGYPVQFIVMERTGAGIKNIKQEFNEGGGFVLIGFTDEKESIKFRGNEERKDIKIVSPTSGEIDNVAKTQTEEVKLFIQEIIQKAKK